MFEYILIGLILLVTLFFLGRSLYRVFYGKSTGCSCGSACTRVRMEKDEGKTIISPDDIRTLK